MTHLIRCRTLFDISATGVRSHYRESRIPFRDDIGQDIKDLASWNRARNQQRNWETLNQIISLRCLPENITTPVAHKNIWSFVFDISSLASSSRDENAVGWFLHDSQGIPMITGLNEDSTVSTTLMPGVNIWFDVVGDKYQLPGEQQ